MCEFWSAALIAQTAKLELGLNESSVNELIGYPLS